MKKIFLVEDEPNLREMIAFLLTDQGYEVEAFPTATSFNNFIEKEEPDMVLLDIRLPDGNGAEICKKMHKSKRHIPVILMSAHANPEMFGNVGARDFIPKPFDIEDLFLKIENEIA